MTGVELQTRSEPTRTTTDTMRAAVVEDFAKPLVLRDVAIPSAGAGQILVRIESPERTVSVVDYLPKTLHEARLSSPIGISITDERNASIGINVAGKYEIFTTLGASAGLGQKTTSCVKYDLLPPLETVVMPS